MESEQLDAARPVPDFVIPGFSKSGTTTLFEWFAACPEVSRGAAKEPAFFAEDHLWAQGWDWYAGRIGDPSQGLVGDGSPHYLDPEWSEKAAARIAEHRPDVKLLVLYRDPLERAISHFRHEVRRNRDTTPVADVASALTIDSAYVRASRYGTGFKPFAERFDPDQILLIPLERLSDTGWSAALRHVGLDDRSPPEPSRNVGSRTPAWTPLMRILHERGILQKAIEIAPRRIRRLGARVLMKDPVDAAPPIDVIREQLDPTVASLLADEWRQFEELRAPFLHVPVAT